MSTYILKEYRMFYLTSTFTHLGGAGSKGEVLSLEGSTDNTGTRNVVRVKWEKGGSNICRVGANGKVDLKFVEECPGTIYFKDHLPRLGKLWSTFGATNLIEIKWGWIGVGRLLTCSPRIGQEMSKGLRDNL